MLQPIALATWPINGKRGREPILVYCTVGAK